MTLYHSHHRPGMTPCPDKDHHLQSNIDNNFQTNTRGLKVRGVYSTQEEAEARCKMLREIDANHDVYVGPVGLWMPWDPEAYKTGRVEYLEEELNKLIADKQENEEKANTKLGMKINLK